MAMLQVLFITADPDNSGVDIYMSTGGAPEGVLAAAALRCIGGQMQCRLVLDTDEKRERAARMGVSDPQKIFLIEDMVRGDCLFAATGVTNGALVSGVKFRKHFIETENHCDALGDGNGSHHQGAAPSAGKIPR
jgi:fructose-1,6-bisphosphatase II / sedoheptulose-1,7-bisphosphatase